jgi:hypothetical protein
MVTATRLVAFWDRKNTIAGALTSAPSGRDIQPLVSCTGLIPVLVDEVSSTGGEMFCFDEGGNLTKPWTDVGSWFVRCLGPVQLKWLVFVLFLHEYFFFSRASISRRFVW